VAALSILLGMLAMQPSALDHYQAGSKAFVEQRFDAAITALEQSLRVHPIQLRAVRLLGLSYQLAGRLHEAEATFQKATELAPNDGESWYFLGRVCYVRNFFDKAQQALQKAVKYSPKDARIRETLALTLEALGDPSAAEKEYQQARRGGTTPATLDLNHGALLLKMNRLAESEPLLVKAASEMPRFWQAHFELARLYYQTDRMEAALRELGVAAGCAGGTIENSRTHALKALVYSRLGRHEEARRAAAAAEK